MAKTKDVVSIELPVIPTLVEVNKDGLYILAYCPVCDKSEKAKLDYPGQSRNSVASVAKIREHFEKKHRTKIKQSSARQRQHFH